MGPRREGVVQRGFEQSSSTTLEANAIPRTV